MTEGCGAISALGGAGSSVCSSGASTRLSFATGADLSISIYRRTLYQPYSVHVSRNSSQVISGISGKANTVIYATIVPALTLISSSIMLFTILMALLTDKARQ